MFCRRQRRSFLVDSGADVSVFPASPAQRRGRQSAALRAANGSSINTFGSKSIPLLFPGLSVVHKFLLAAVKKPILGTDFFRAKNLLIDIPNHRLVSAPPADYDGCSRPRGVVVRARPAQFDSGLCGLRCIPTPSSTVAPAAIAALFDAFPAVTASSPVYDSSLVAVGAVLSFDGVDGPPVAFFSKKLTAAQVKYSAFDR